MSCIASTECGDIHVDKDEFIAHQGEAAHFFWILLEGELRVFQTQTGWTASPPFTRWKAETPSANCRFWPTSPTRANVQSNERRAVSCNSTRSSSGT